MAIQIGKYNRPGIFMEEIDQSLFSAPGVEGITNLVIGVSKKGPVNTPIRLTTITDLESVFGQLDRNLERKGSFFHRTISKMLETTPVYAMNLLLTDDNLDIIEYKSLSSSALKSNDIKREGPYRRFFDTTGFWKRDTESFINLTKDNDGYADRAFSFTNLSDKYITAFVVKTQVSGFDRTLLEWYGSVEKMPPYVNASDYASDYMVDVVVVGGDWTNYRELAVDTRWGQYFNADGLIKGQLRNFANDRNMTLLGYYEGLSLIPYFRDLEGRNIFIETVINRDTDSSGLYCAFNADLIEEEFYTGLIDLIGGTLVGSGKESIDFLSYKEQIIESVDFTSTPLDLPGNVVALFGTSSYSDQLGHAYGNPKENGIVYNGENRSAWFTDGASLNINLVGNVGTSSISGSGTSSTVTISYAAHDNAFAIINSQYVPVNAGTVSTILKSADYPFSAATASFTTVFVLGTDGEISHHESLVAGVNPNVATTDTVLGYVTLDVRNSGFVGITFSNVTVTNTQDVITPGYTDGVYLQSGSYNDLIYGTNSNTADYYVTDLSNTTGFTTGDIKVEFFGTSAEANTRNYKQYRKIKMFNTIISFIDSINKDRVSMVVGADSNGRYIKKSMSSMSVTNIVRASSQNKSFVLRTGLSDVSYLSGVNGGALIFYRIDNEFILGTDGIRTKDEPATSDTGVVGKYSDFYQKYFNGLINTGDYFYDNRLYTAADGINPGVLLNNGVAATVNVTFVNGEASPSPTSLVITGENSDYAGYNYIVFETPTIGATAAANALDLNVAEIIKFPASQNNTGTFTIVPNSVVVSDSAHQLAVALGFTGSNHFAYQVSENVIFEEISNVTMMYNINDKHYLKMLLNLNGGLEVDFTDSSMLAINDIDVETNYTFNAQSEINNFKQTLEIEVPVGYVEVPNKILVNGSRYSEVKVGDFLLADNSGVELEPGQTLQRNFTRILSKRQYAANPALMEISCDAKIKKTGYTSETGFDYQTTRYSSVDQYVSTYKGIALKGFRIRQASLPDGTEDKQNQILNLVAKGTPLFKSLTNKEAFNFRYLIDAFGLGLTERSKQQLVDICGERLDAFGFINMPSLKSFKNSSSPSFVNSEGVLQAEFIALGGDPESNPAFLYSFADGPGNTCVGYFTPYVTVNDNGRPLDMPPAAHVATTYVRKHISIVGSITPWTISAGVINGRITNIPGIEHEFDPNDIAFLNKAQMNPIVLKRNRGYVIETENTALTLYKSALSVIHVREVLIELERELAAMLLDYQWKYNTPDVRAEIKLRADVICETYVNKNGLYNYFNKMDDENNTAEIIDNQIGVLDTYVEPIKGMGIIVNNVTILRTGAIASGGFINY